MCGIAGLLSKRNLPLYSIVSAMANAVAHRGPDDLGIWSDDVAGIALGHRRLSILDLSPQGHQPMVSACGRYVVTFNGEIYNHLELRSALEKSGRVERRGWRGHSDTETLLAAISAWGVEKTLVELNGMFAFAVWDAQQRSLTLARDRIGEKPLYYACRDDLLAFGSELKALRTIPGMDLEVDRRGVAQVLRYGYIAAPLSIYGGVQKLPPGTSLSVSLRDMQPVLRGPIPYWTLQRRRLNLDETEATAQLEALLTDAVQRQMIADVPLGAFLSGGVDSSLVVALMQAKASRPVRTFTIGFREQAYDESRYAAAVARHLGTDHTELFVTPADVMAIIPRLPEIYDEPFADSSQIPTSILAQLTRRHVKVSLSGDGGDELFGGYARYEFAQRIWKQISTLPRSVRSAFASGLGAIPPRGWDRMLAALPGGAWRGAVTSHRMHRMREVLTASDFSAMYERLFFHWMTLPEAGRREPPSADVPKLREEGSQLCQMRWRDLAHYLPDDILTKVDRATMHAGLESRAPFLDHRVVEFAFSLPDSLLVKNGTGKLPLRGILHRLVPRKLFERPKSGFSIPVGEWLRGPLRDWAESLLSDAALGAHGLLDPTTIRQTWSLHLSGLQNAESRLWSVLMFQAWYFATRSAAGRP
jgi:asparagine synthase (glutamine-hydrolysing)